MNFTADIGLFRRRLDEFKPSADTATRLLALYSAAIALADDASMRACLRLGRAHDIARGPFYEIVLQSYLFLGFPRMLTAAEILHDEFANDNPDSRLAPVSADESAEWFERGVALCRQVYDGNYELLKDRVEGMAPDVFRWMVLEGYGKVLSRPELPFPARELAIVACLVIENRPKQLFSHMKGALNVGVTPASLSQIVEDIGPAAGDGYTSALDIARRLGVAQ